VSYPLIKDENYIASVAMRKVKFDRSNLPKNGNYPMTKLTNQELGSADKLHMIMHNIPNDGGTLQLIETNGNILLNN